MSRVFSKKDLLGFWLGLIWKLGAWFKICYKQILNHVAILCNLFFEIFLHDFEENVKKFL